MASYTVQCKSDNYTFASEEFIKKFKFFIAELGDYNQLEHLNGYLSSLRLLGEQTEEAERRISELHKLHRGQLPADAEYNYLEHAKKLYMYGVDLHKAIDSTGKEINLGVTSVGLVVFQNNVRMNVFSWSKMVKISFKRKEFFIQLRREPVSCNALHKRWKINSLILVFSPKRMIRYLDLAWVRIKTQKLCGNHVSNIIHSFVWSVRIVCRDFCHYRSVQNSTILAERNCKRYKRVNNVVKYQRYSHDHLANVF